MCGEIQDYGAEEKRNREKEMKKEKEKKKICFPFKNGLGLYR